MAEQLAGRVGMSHSVITEETFDALAQVSEGARRRRPGAERDDNVGAPCPVDPSEPAGKRAGRTATPPPRANGLPAAPGGRLVSAGEEKMLIINRSCRARKSFGPCLCVS